MNKPVLEMQNISKSFGITHALQNINFELMQGEVHALLGENGAGKSTLIKVLGGIHKPDTGEIWIGEQKVEMDSVSAAYENGIGIIHQEIVLVPHLTIAENIFLGREYKNKFGLLDSGRMFDEAQKMADAIGSGLNVYRKVAELSIAQQQMVEIIKAISFNVKILVMDEPTSSLSDEEVETLFGIIGNLQQRGVSIIYISHRMEEIFRISNRVTVIRDGTYIGTRETAKTNADELVSMMVGRSLGSFYISDHECGSDVVLSVRGLSRFGFFKDVSFDVRSGEVLGFAGLVGAGRSEIMRAVFGADSFDSGEVILKGKSIHNKDVIEAMHNGIAMVPEDRKKQGLILCNSVGFNITLSAQDKVSNGCFLNRRKIVSLIDRFGSKLNIKAPSDEVKMDELSGGNQQKVVLAKWLAVEPKVLILDEPTRGIDVGAKQEIYGIINQLAKQGIAVIIVSSELPELLNICDSICVVKNGSIAVQLDKAEASQETIMKYATGGIDNAG